MYKHTLVGNVWRLTGIEDLLPPGATFTATPRKIALSYTTNISGTAQLTRITDEAGKQHNFEYNQAGVIYKYYNPENVPSGANSKPVINGYQAYRVVSQTLSTGVTSQFGLEPNCGFGVCTKITTTAPTGEQNFQLAPLVNIWTHDGKS